MREALAVAAARLQRAGCDTPRLDAEVLLADVLGVDRARLVLDAHVTLKSDAAQRFWALVGRREEHEPVAYLVGRRHFRHLTLAVDRRVLIPRPETELLVEAALELPRGSRVVDVGTGSGAVALALADERPDLEVWASDVSPDALAVARANALALGLTVHLVASDLLADVPGPCDAVLANLPYVAPEAVLPRDVAGFEPALALYAGDAGLEIVRRLVGQLGGVAFVALEVGEGQADAVAALLRDAGFGDVERRRDLAGIERVVVGRRDPAGVEPGVVGRRDPAGVEPGVVGRRDPAGVEPGVAGRRTGGAR